MTVTTTDIVRCAARVKAEIAALTACAPAHADIIAASVLGRVARELLADGVPSVVVHIAARNRGAAREN